MVLPRVLFSVTGSSVFVPASAVFIFAVSASAGFAVFIEAVVASADVAVASLCLAPFTSQRSLTFISFTGSAWPDTMVVELATRFSPVLTVLSTFTVSVLTPSCFHSADLSSFIFIKATLYEILLLVISVSVCCTST